MRQLASNDGGSLMLVMTRTKTALRMLPFLLCASASAADPDRGRLLYENHCGSCHESGVHIREVQAAKSLEAVRVQVVRWQEAMNLLWSAEDVGDVVEFLNAAWYHYGR